MLFEKNILIFSADASSGERTKDILVSAGYNSVILASNIKQSKLVAIQHTFNVVLYFTVHKKNISTSFLQSIDPTNVPYIFLCPNIDQNVVNKLSKYSHNILLCPCSNETLLQVINQILAANAYQKNTSLNGPQKYFFIKLKDKYEKVTKSQILFLKADGTYTIIVTESNTYKYYHNLNKILQLLDNKNILRCHRSYAVNVKKVQAFDDEGMYFGETGKQEKIPLGGNFREEIMRRLVRLG